MNQGVIQNFLNLPGMAGMALMDGMSCPCFYGFQADLEGSQQHAVAQNIQQVLETAPEGFTSFEFQFDLYRVYLHKLNQTLTLLVLTDNRLSRSTYLPTVRHLLLELQLNQTNLIGEFRDILAQIPAPRLFRPPQSEAKRSDLPIAASPPVSISSTESVTELVPVSPTLTASSPGNSSPDNSSPDNLSPDNLSPGNSSAAVLPSAVSVKEVSVKEMLAAMNSLSQFTTQYLGTLVVANYWQSTRPPDDWLLHFQIERSAQITFIVQVPSERLPLLSEEQYHSIKRWIAAFVERCSKIIRNFAHLLQQSLDRRHQSLLFDRPT